MFNLGYLPGGDKAVVTRAEETVRALEAAQRAVRAGGAVSATIYPGHDEGRREEAAVLEHAAALPQGEWSVHVRIPPPPTAARPHRARPHASARLTWWCPLALWPLTVHPVAESAQQADGRARAVARAAAAHE